MKFTLQPHLNLLYKHDINRHSDFNLDSIKNESSFLTSSKSVSEIYYDKKGFADVFIGSREQSQKSPMKIQSKLQFDLKTIHTWINTTI